VVRVRKVCTTVAAAIAAFSLLVVILPCDRTGLDQGCINQGEDCRKFAIIVCFLQRHLSWNSGHEPHFLTVGPPDQTQVAVAWPPYFVFNTHRENGRWLMFRIGFRYDCNWHGYIFPSLALKTVNRPLLY